MSVVVDETVRYGGPQRVLYSEDRMTRCDWRPISPRHEGYIGLQWRHDGDDRWHDERHRMASGFGAEESYVQEAIRLMAGFTRPHRLDRTHVMGHGPGAISWAVDRRPGVITVEIMDDGQTYPPAPSRLTIDQAQAAVAYLTTPDPSRGWFGVDTVAFHAGSVPGLGLADFGGFRIRISTAEWVRVLSDGIAALTTA
jgi:hypothetical protein